MKYKLPPLNGLLAFEAAARNENFAKAAQELNLSQATVSHRVRMLEKHLGYALFERLPRGLKLTESGKAYVPSIRKAFEQIFSSTSGIFGRRDSGSLTVRAPVSYSILWLSPSLRRFLDVYPGIDVRLISSIWPDPLAADETDIDLRLGFGNWPGYNAEKLLEEIAVPVCKPSEHDAIRSVADLVGRPLIHVMGMEDLWMKYFAQAGLAFGADRHDIRVDSAASAVEIVASSDRVALIQKRLLDRHLSAGSLVVPIDVEIKMEQTIYFVSPRSGYQPKPEAILFRQWLEDLCA